MRPADLPWREQPGETAMKCGIVDELSVMDVGEGLFGRVEDIGDLGNGGGPARDCTVVVGTAGRRGAIFNLAPKLFPN